jgi:hypothetical protein
MDFFRYLCLVKKGSRMAFEIKSRLHHRLYSLAVTPTFELQKQAAAPSHKIKDAAANVGGMALSMEQAGKAGELEQYCKHQWLRDYEVTDC